MNELEQIGVAVEAMDQAQWGNAISLLIRLLPAAERSGPQLETTVRILLAQSMHSEGDQHNALEQARKALQTAELTNDRGLIWKCMALLTSMEIIEDGRL